MCDCGWFGEIGKTAAGEKILKFDEKDSGAISSENTFATFGHECSKCGHAERKSGAI